MSDIIEKSFENQVKDLQELIRIPSVSRGEPKEGMPYGENVYNALRKAQEIAKKLGFEKVILPAANRKNIREEGMELVFVKTVTDAVRALRL